MEYTKEEALNELGVNTHDWFDVQGSTEILLPFGIDPEGVMEMWTDTSDQFKGLSLDGCVPGDQKRGASAEALACAINRKVGGDRTVADRFHGRGSRVRAVVDEAVKHL